MILRKPYAFLIRYFKLIHIIILFFATYLSIRTFSIVKFFNDYVSSGYYTYSSNISGTYINFFMYISILIILLSALAIYFLMKKKDKPRNLYIAIIVYYVFLLIILSITHSILIDLETSLINVKSIRAYRDLSVIIVAPQIYYLLTLFIRGIGFDIKKFNFAKDLQELEISEKDSEEFEFVVGFEGYKVKRRARRSLRELRYYFLENKFIILMIGCIILILIGTSIYFNTGVFDKKYKKEDTFAVNNMQYTIEDAYLTNLSYDGTIISNNKYFLIIKYLINNPSMTTNTITLSDFRLLSDNGNIYPTKIYNDHFVDLGTPYKTQTFLPNNSKSLMLIYQIDSKWIKKTYDLLIVESIKHGVGELSATYRKILVKPTLINEIKEESTNKFDETINLSSSNLGNSSITFSGVTSANNYRYYYDFCYKDNCVKSSDIISANYQGSTPNRLYIFSYSLILDEKTDYYKSIKNTNDFFNKYLSLRYSDGDETKIIKLKNVTPNYVTDKIVLEGSNKAYLSDKIDLLITIRNKQYIINIK